MRVNIYAEELTPRVELVHKRTQDGEFLGVRFYLELPIRIPVAGGHAIEHRGPFIHRPGDDDSSAVTFWGKRDMRKILREALKLLDDYYCPTAQDFNRAHGGETVAQQESDLEFPYPPRQAE